MLLLLLLQGFFSGAEIAIVSCDRAKLRHRARPGDAGSRLALRMLERPEVLLSTTLVGTNISLVLLTALATTLAITAFGNEGDLLAVLLLAPVTLTLGEVVPKSVYQQVSNDLTPKIIYPLYAFSLLFWPIVFVFSRLARMAARLSGAEKSGAQLFAVREQLRTVLDTAEGATTLDVFDRERLRNVVRFGELTAGDVMVPAAEMMAIDADAPIEQLARLVRRTGSAHFPAYEGKRSNILGMLSVTVWDLVEPRFRERSVRDFIKPAHFVPAQQALVELLPLLRSRADESAVIVDEFGSAIGLVTIDRILETVVGPVIVGEVFEEADKLARPSYEQVADDTYLLDGRLAMQEVNELLGTRIALSEARTIGGLIVARLRHVPAVDESLEEAGFRFTVVAASDRAVTRLRAERIS
jgi:CBS domain containing-hemolysin-like protein